jgi:hypothetical protein
MLKVISSKEARGATSGRTEARPFPARIGIRGRLAEPEPSANVGQGKHRNLGPRPKAPTPGTLQPRAVEGVKGEDRLRHFVWCLGPLSEAGLVSFVGAFGPVDDKPNLAQKGR